MEPDSSLGIAMCYRLDSQGTGFPLQAGARNFSFLHNVQTAPGDHAASYPMDTGGGFPGGKEVVT